MQRRIEIIGAPAYSWGRRSSLGEEETPGRGRRLRKGRLAGVLVTLFVIAAGAGGGLALLAASGARSTESVAYAAPALPELAPLPELPPMASLEGLRDPAPVVTAAAPPIAAPEATTASAPEPPRRAARRPARRVRRVEADASDAFRRARRVGGDRL